MLSRSPEFTYRRLLMASKMAEKMGAQIMGLGAFTKVVGDAGVTVARRSRLPITTGNSYSASGALWAAHDAMRRMGLVPVPPKGQRVQAKTMVIGASGSIGSVSARLLAMAFEEVVIAGRDMKKLEELKKSILEDTPDANVTCSTDYDELLGDMDMIVTSTSGAGKKILDITKVKPGCVITDVARPLDLPPEEVAKRPDVLVIESGEIELPTKVRGMKSIGLPPNVIYACLAETIVLALEGRFEVFTIGRDTEWEKVKEIYKLGLKHGMKLSAISGVNGVFTDEDIAKVVALAKKARLTWKGSSTAGTGSRRGSRSRAATAAPAPARRRAAKAAPAAEAPAPKATRPRKAAATAAEPAIVASVDTSKATAKASAKAPAKTPSGSAAKAPSKSARKPAAQPVVTAPAEAEPVAAAASPDPARKAARKATRRTAKAVAA
jgi:predicted amino acid dehydrogenase